MEWGKSTTTSTTGCLQVNFKSIQKKQICHCNAIYVNRNKAEIHSKRADLAKEKLMEVMRCYEQKLQAQSIDIQRLQEAHGRLRSEQSTCQTMHQQPELVAESLRERQRYKIVVTQQCFYEI